MRRENTTNDLFVVALWLIHAGAITDMIGRAIGVPRDLWLRLHLRKPPT